MTPIHDSKGSHTAAQVPDQVPLTREAFEAALRGQSDKYWHKHPFHEHMHAGRLTRQQIQGWAANRYYYQKSISMKDAAILSNCPDPAVRRRWIERIIYHDGAAEGQGGLHSWLQLTEAVGLTREEVLDERHVIPGVRFAVDAYVTFARTRPWIEAVAASLSELFAPNLMQDRLDAFVRHYAWIAPAGHDYFKARVPQAASEGTYALELVIQRCTTREQQERAVAALAFKCDVLWSMLDAIHHAYGVG